MRNDRAGELARAQGRSRGRVLPRGQDESSRGSGGLEDRFAKLVAVHLRTTGDAELAGLPVQLVLGESIELVAACAAPAPLSCPPAVPSASRARPRR